MRPKKLTDDGFLEIARVAQERDKIPSDKELADRLRVSCSTIKAAMQRARGVSGDVPRGSSVNMLVPCSRCGGPRDRAGQKYCRACHAAYQREHRPKYSELTPEQRLKSNSRTHANVAQKRGQIVKKPCEKCGDPESEKHHEDYSKPLEVRWLCARCHRVEHETIPKCENDSVELGLAKP